MNVHRALKTRRSEKEYIGVELHIPVPTRADAWSLLDENGTYHSIPGTYLKNGTYVPCRMNRVSLEKQAFLGFVCLYLLQQQNDGGSSKHFVFGEARMLPYMRPPHNYPMIDMLLSLVHGCFFGMVMEAKCNKEYALLVGLEDEFIDNKWRDYDASKYIEMRVETNYKSLDYILDILEDASNTVYGHGILSGVEPAHFMIGIISICALPIPNLITKMFTKYNHELPDALDAFFKVCVDEFTVSVQEAWQVNGGTETNRRIISDGGKCATEYFNVDNEFLQGHEQTIILPEIK
jgi:hypothetical protein